MTLRDLYVAFMLVFDAFYEITTSIQKSHDFVEGTGNLS